ncbi:MAG: DUF4139 domain-containing protein, partial [Candidatus Cloacimonadota bacterium]|nr:DUF4139 domain-containing protein [Candidatus Cloacimonadota bacterium]
MKHFILILLLVASTWLIATQLTVYNDNFALVKDNLKIELPKGIVDYNFSDIPSTIEANSVIFTSQNKNLTMVAQNFEFDLASYNAILNKYIGKPIRLNTKTERKFNGKLQFFDNNSLGILEETTGELIIINRQEIVNIDLSQLPENFYLKPTLHWKFQSPAFSNYQCEISYLCKNITWEITYNTVWDEKELTINSWVTLTNNSGKSFNDTNLKLIAGEVRKLSETRYSAYKNGRALTESASIPEFEEKSFHDFHLYTLSEKVNIKNKQTKQLQLFPTTTVKANSKYVYSTYSNKIASLIIFQNTKKAGLGIPLPKGNLKVYKKDKIDDQLEFIGEDKMEHTAKDEEIEITTGFAFDLVA